jgi:hypothetical protein
MLPGLAISIADNCMPTWTEAAKRSGTQKSTSMLERSSRVVMADWLLDGDPGMDLWEMDVRRFGAHYRSPTYTLKRTREVYETYYDVKYPGHERQAGRPLRVSPAYSRLAELCERIRRVGQKHKQLFLHLQSSQVERKVYQYVPIKHVLSWTPSDASAGPIMCGGQVIPDDVLTNNVVFCADGHYFILDTNYLQHAYDDIGDFGVTTLVARPWAEYVETLKGIPGAGTGDPASLLQADCYTGGFTAAMTNGQLSSQTLGGRVEISPGDLDEAIQAFILAQKVHPNAVDPFTRVEAFRQGFLKGYVSCGSVPSAGGPSTSPSPTA